MKKIIVIFLWLVLLWANGCIGGGTHGYIKRYKYNIPKNELQKIVNQVIVNSPTIQKDTMNNYYNNDTTYVTMFIKYNELNYEYTFRYYGGKEYWDTSRTSSISISYAYDEKRNGGSEGNNGVKKSNKKLIKKLTEPFQEEFIFKIDSILEMKHIEE